MGFDPGTMMALASAFSTLMGSLTGEKGGQKSSFSKGQQGGINDIIQQIKGMGGAPDITQNQNFQQGQGFLDNLFNDPSFFQNIEAPALRQFDEQIAPDIANRFASMGSGGSMGSTAFRNQMNREGSNLAQNLSAQRTGMQQQGANQSLGYAQQPFSNIMQLYNQALGQPMMNQYQGPSTGGFGSLGAPFAQGAASYWGGQGGQNNNQSSFQPSPNMSRTYPGQFPSTQ